MLPAASSRVSDLPRVVLYLRRDNAALVAIRKQFLEISAIAGSWLLDLPFAVISPWSRLQFSHRNEQGREYFSGCWQSNR
jgi:predicted YcjX-like family ATPase